LDVVSGEAMRISRGITQTKAYNIQNVSVKSRVDDYILGR
jgi:hypothetical protein